MEYGGRTQKRKKKTTQKYIKKDYKKNGKPNKNCGRTYTTTN